MVASVPEVIPGTLTAVSASVPITTVLVPTDLVVCISSFAQSSAQAVTPSGLGTWSGDVNGIANGTNDYGIRVHMLTGVTGAGSITLSASSVSNSPQYVILVISGLGAAILDGRHAVFTSGAAPTLQARARDNSVAVNVVHAGTGTPVNPATASPSTGWVNDRNTVSTGGISVSHNIIGTGQIVTTTNTAVNYALGSTSGLYIFGAPLETRLQADYDEALVGGDGASPGRALDAQSTEIVVGPAAPPPAAVHGLYAESIWTGPSTTRLNAESVEILAEALAGSLADARLTAESVEIIANALPHSRLLTESVSVISQITPPEANASILANSISVISSFTPPATGAALRTDYVTVIAQAKRSELVSRYIEVLRLYDTSAPPAGASGMGWGIPI